MARRRRKKFKPFPPAKIWDVTASREAANASKAKSKKKPLAGRRRETRFSELSRFARDNGLYVAMWSPGDGVTRYRFFDKPGNSYFGPDNGICTALGIKNAWKYLQTGTCPTTRRRRR